MRPALWALAASVAFCGCVARTTLHPEKPKQAPPPKFVAPQGCNVRDFRSATDLPAGSKNIGWVTVAQQGSDEETTLLLRKKICELGGDALSQLAWVKGPTDEVPQLTANAWTLP